MTLYSSENCLDCHRVRVVLAEKGLNVEIIHIEQDRSAVADLAELSPYGEPPTLVDRDLVVYGTWVVTEYLDERYPHPPLMPVDPVSRSRLRLALYRIHRDWIENGRIIETSSGPKRIATARQQLRDSIIESDPLFGLSPFLLNDELSLVDCALLPMLWRLPTYGVDLPAKSTRNIQRYMDRMFARDAFQRSLTEVERSFREEEPV
ncbi:stringent starvation protein A [Wenzhouxiangella sp. XN79A]|uniref:glutathione S-transferase N-terminal domain-containing protein n=1 Tax=Wenzhouxiangella sp. XN79A TaxID=2724193 RepID=UPI00144AEFF8|nr:glutathione S-transferase N-terminal domain-containing protein [Wenzhouxiangella sp. XN79A]NKI34218.1 stringent starvation protein A [Wenzhouxiangella sp. XN79A]